MVLRIFLVTFLILFQATDANAISRKKRRAFKQAKSAYKKENYSSAVSILKKNFNLKSRKTPIGAVQLAGYCFVKLKQFKNADATFSTLIKRKYRRTSGRIVKKYKKAGNADDVGDIPSTLASYYYYKALAQSQIFMNDYEKLGDPARKKYKESAIMFASLAVEGEFEDEDPEQIIADLTNFNKKKESVKFKYGTFLGVNYVTWRDELTVIESSGAESTLISNSEGLCLGGGLRKYNAEWEYNVNGCVGINNATVGSNASSALDYFQKNVPVIGIMGAVAALWKPKTTGTAIGIHLPVMFRKGEYDHPRVADPVKYDDAEFNGTSAISFGALVEGKWHFEKWEFSMKFGKLTGMDSSLWSLGMLYGF